MGNFWKHSKTIARHRHLVIMHCCMAGHPFMGLLHDISKYSPEEFFAGVKYFQGNKSPNEGERRVYGYSKAWMHHKGRNKHHFEYWTDYNIETKTMTPVKMPVRYVIEMFCDRVAASKVYQKGTYTDAHPLEYFLKAKGRRVIHPETSDMLEKFLTMLARDGEEKTFRYIKNNF